MQGWERAINTLSVRRPQPHNTDHRTKEEKGKTEGDKKEAALALPLSLAHLLKPASPTPSRRRGHQYQSTEILIWK